MHRARKWLRNSLFRPVKIPPLPDEILVNIFEYLTPEERLSIRLVSRRFRDLELTIGNRTFKIVHFLVVDGAGVEDAVVAQLPSRGEYIFDADKNCDFEIETPAVRKFFKGAVVVDRFIFLVEKNREPFASQYMLSLLKLISFNDFFLLLKGTTDFSDLIESIFKNIKTDKLIATFEWPSLKGQNVVRLQEVMKNLPKLEAVYVKDPDKRVPPDDPENFIVTGPLMLTMIRIAPKVQLDCIHCTTQDLLIAFQIVCESRIHKCARFVVVESATDNLLSLAEQRGFVVEGYAIFDNTRGYQMFVVYEPQYAVAGFEHVLIRRIDKDGKYIDSDSD